jgi:hypothetical protein
MVADGRRVITPQHRSARQLALLLLLLFDVLPFLLLLLLLGSRKRHYDFPFTTDVASCPFGTDAYGDGLLCDEPGRDDGC